MEISATGTDFTQASWLEMWFETNNGSDTYANLSSKYLTIDLLKVR